MVKGENENSRDALRSGIFAVLYSGESSISTFFLDKHRSHLPPHYPSRDGY